MRTARRAAARGRPVRVLLADVGVGRGDKVAWYGINRYVSNKLRITAGIAADGVSGVVLRDDAGRHEVAVEANAFLYVAEDPEVGQQVSEVMARTAAGLVAVPYAPIPSAIGSSAGPAPPPPAPAVEREVTGGTIGWLDDREERGEPLDVLPKDSLKPGFRLLDEGEVVFGRVLTPDPDQPVRTVVTLNADRAGGPVAWLCTWHRLTRHGGGGGGCSPYPGLFDRGPAIFGGGSYFGPSAFVNAHGVVSDDVARLEAVLADRQVADVPMADNVYAVDLPRAEPAGAPRRLRLRGSRDRGQPPADGASPATTQCRRGGRPSCSGASPARTGRTTSSRWDRRTRVACARSSSTSTNGTTASVKTAPERDTSQARRYRRTGYLSGGWWARASATT